jgi:hypothetical protein
MAVPRPNVFLIGAMKAGTSYLSGLLGEHPAVFMSTEKEPCHFVDEQVLRRVWFSQWTKGYWRSEAHYLRLFAEAGDASIVMEASTPYTQAPLFAGVVQRILAFNPAARFIYIMRDPLQRTVSHYWHRVRWWGERRAMLRAIRSDSHYTDVSYYARQLHEYLRYVDRERIYVLTYEALLTDAFNELRGLFVWLGVDPLYRPGRIGIPVNVTPAVIRKPRGLGLLDNLRQTSLYSSAISPVLPSAMRRLGSKIAAVTVRPAEVPLEGVMSYLRPIQRRQTQELSVLLNRTFPEWEMFWEPERDRQAGASPAARNERFV